MNTLVIINNMGMGHGDEALGETLIGAYLRKIWARDDKPKSIVLYNSGVKLISNSSPVLDVLNGLEDAGVDIVACGTCINHYKLEEHINVGRRSGMEEIVEMMSKADKVITL